MIEDPVEELGRILQAVGAHVTCDRHRNHTHACYRCGTIDQPRDLVSIGFYTRPFGENLQPGDRIVRPLCAACERDTRPEAGGAP